MGACGVKVLCYNWMPSDDWTRTALDLPEADDAAAPPQELPGAPTPNDDDAASAASLRSDIESAVAVLAREQANCASRLSKLDAQLSSSSEPPAKLRERHAEASEETAMLARRRDRLERAASELDAMEVALNGSDAPPDER